MEWDREIQRKWDEKNLNGCWDCLLTHPVHDIFCVRLYLLVEPTHFVSQSWDSGNGNHNRTAANGNWRATECECWNWNTTMEYWNWKLRLGADKWLLVCLYVCLKLFNQQTNQQRQQLLTTNQFVFLIFSATSFLYREALVYNKQLLLPTSNE